MLLWIWHCTITLLLIYFYLDHFIKGAHAPSKPHVQVLGRNELHVTWEPPEVPLGRITRYDVLMNGKIIYSGTELSYAVRRLTPDTEYSFVVSLSWKNNNDNAFHTLGLMYSTCICISILIVFSHIIDQILVKIHEYVIIIFDLLTSMSYFLAKYKTYILLLLCFMVHIWQNLYILKDFLILWCKNDCETVDYPLLKMGACDICCAAVPKFTLPHFRLWL